MAESERLKLRAHDIEDMDVIAACLQDALVPLSEVAFVEGERRFVLVCNRFMWERTPEGVPSVEPAPAEPEPAAEEASEGEPRDASFEEAEARPAFYRTNCGLTFDRVRRVAVRGLDLKDRQQILNLLTVSTEPRRITLLFSGGGLIRLDVSQLRCHLEDLGEPWPTWSRPEHALDEIGAAR